MITKPAKILVVDDDELQRKLTSTQLEAAGFAVVAANGALEAIELAREQPPDLILSDLLLGDIDGFGLCRRLQDDPLLATVPVVLVSAHFGGRRDQELARQVGALAFIERSSDFTNELIAVKACLNEHRRGRPAGSVLMLTSDTTYEQHLQAQASKLLRLADQKRRTEYRMAALLEGTHSTYIVTTPEGIILEANPRWKVMLGLEPSEMIGQKLDDLIPYVDVHTTGVVPLCHNLTGKTVFVELTVTRTPEEVLLIGHDVTPRIEAELRSAGAEANLRKVVQEQMHAFAPLEDFDDAAVTRPIPRLR